LNNIEQFDNPLVSIIIPTFNRGHLLPDAVNSCLNQTLKNLEIIIVDDGSSDNTKQVVSELQASQSSKGKIRYFSQLNSGASVARNHGFKQARGDFIQFLDSDDVLEATKLEKQYKKLYEFENEEVACCSCYGVIESLDEILPSINKIRLGVNFKSPEEAIRIMCGRVVHVMPTPAPLWRRGFLEQHSGWNESIALGDDLEFHIRLLVTAKRISFIEDELFSVREHNGPRLGTEALSDGSLASIILTRKEIYKQVHSNGLWDIHIQFEFLRAMRTIYANALKNGNKNIIYDLESWMLLLSSYPNRILEIQLLVALRRVFGVRFLLGIHNLISKF
jgi:glycosyltransferase involved in cell wall biosynthesis